MAAAYAALISLEHIIHTLQLHPHPPISLPKNLLLLLAQKLTFLQEFLEGYNLHDLDYTKEADPLEVRIADAAHAAEDAIESHIVDHISNDREKMMSWDALYQALDKVIQDMAFIEKEAIEIKETAVGVQHQLHKKSTPSDSLRSSSSIAQNSIMVGVDDIKLQLRDKLTSHCRDLQIIPIVGMGGTGKTTLARNIYQQRLIKKHFFICGWATISQQYSIREIFTQILRQLNPNFDQHSSEGKLGEMLHKHLYNRKYLIIMDDMWSINAWDRARNFFPNNKNGSRIVVTTRLSKLSSKLPGSDIIEMRFLNEANSWELLSKTVFGEESCPLELEEVGKKIGKSCKGLPLSIVVVGGFLAKSNHTSEFWGYVEENLSSIVSLEEDERCLKVISMSYKQLPIYLKPYFLYMGIYREDDEIRVSHLIKLLAAEGFLKPINGMSMEETAKEYLKDLIDRNLILVHELGCTRKIKYCKIHDVVREFCLIEARKERFYYDVRQNSPQSIIDGQRRIVISRCALEKKEIVDTWRPMPLVRSCIWDLKEEKVEEEEWDLKEEKVEEEEEEEEEEEGGGGEEGEEGEEEGGAGGEGEGAGGGGGGGEEEEVPSLDFRLLRVLHAMTAKPSSEAINSLYTTQLVNSRYLAMRRGTSLYRLPSSICRFWNLQTLLFDNNGPTIIALPAEIWCMTQIRHIKFEQLDLPDAPASGEDEMVLGNLHTLAWIRNFKCSEEVLKRIPNLRKLGINTEIIRRDSLSNLGCLHKLESLQVSMKPSEDDFLVNLNLPQSLKKLSLSTWLFKSWQDLWEEMGKLPLLQKLLLDFMESEELELETIEGTFPCLKFLGIRFSEHLEIWTMESSHFPCLERLDLVSVEKLEVPLELAEIPTLRIINLTVCSESVEESAKRLEEIQEEFHGEATVQVQISDSDEEELDSL